MEVYFDNSATTKPYDEVCEEVYNAMKEYYGNPSSLHSLGLKSQRKLMEAKEAIGKTINATKEEILFTSGGSESNNTILRGLAKSGLHIITTAYEHPSILETCNELKENGVSITYLKVNNFGQIDLEELKNSIRKETVLVSVMHVNNEIGSINNIKEISKIVRQKSGRAKIHVDGVQSYGKFKVDVKDLDIDFYSASAHKIHGPKGVGFLYVKKDTMFKPFITGGSQESGRRAGTENLYSILGFVKASEITFKNLNESFDNALKVKSYFIEKLSDIKEIKINSLNTSDFSPYILNISFLGVRAEVLLHILEEKGIFVSTGSACSSKSIVKKGSHVLNSIGLASKEIEGAIRFSFCGYNTIEEVDYTIVALKEALMFLRRLKR
ncbi:MAG: cysteine desulfurase family protein [Sarcina sp.]